MATRLSRRAIGRSVLAQRRQMHHIGRQYRNELRRFFKGQARRVVRIWLDADGLLADLEAAEYKDPGMSLMGSVEDDLLVASSRKYVVDMSIFAANAAGDIIGAETILGTDKLVLELADISASRVVQVNGATRRGIQRAVTKGQAAGFSAYEIANGSKATRKLGFKPLKEIVGPPYLYRGRPDAIARTEMALINNQASLQRWKESGMNLVEVEDGADCGWVTHQDPDKANNTLRSMSAAMSYPIAHPNCRRVFLPTESAPRRR
jgi:Zn ribbon nucleic-acid-binding protein